MNYCDKEGLPMGDIFKKDLKPVVRFLRKHFPVTSKNEPAIRQTDRASAAAGDFGEPVVKEPPIVDGRLNRGKLLIGTTIFYDDKNIDDEDIKLIADGGFDFIINESSGDFQNLLIELCEKYHVALISKDKSLPSGKGIQPALDSGKDLFADYVRHPARIGDTAGDEPNASLFPAMGEYYRLYNKKFPESFLFSNLFPAGTPAKLLGAKNYTEYVAAYVRKVPSDFISLDEYPFFSVSFLKKIAFGICLHTYDVIGSACRENDRDFWLYLQSMGNWFDLIYSLVTYEQIRWQTYAALAYGVKCIMHISYTPVWGTESYAMVDKQGKVTEQYLYAKRVNKELNALSPVYMQYKNLGVLPAIAEKNNRDLKYALNAQKKSSAKKDFYGIDSVEKISSEYSALAGYFKKTDGGGSAIMLVNCRDLYSPEAGQKVSVKLKYPCTVTVYINGKVKQTEKDGNSFSVSLQSCEGAFVTIDKI